MARRGDAFGRGRAPTTRFPWTTSPPRWTSRTRVLSLSWVQFGTGYRADLAAFAELAHSRGAIFIVDVIQGLGALPLDAGALGLDVVATGAHKWLMAPGGTGGLYIAPHVLDRMRLVNMGAGSVVNVGEFRPAGLSRRSPTPSAMKKARRTASACSAWTPPCP